MREVTLKTGAELKITPAPFEQAKAVYQQLMEELKSANMDESRDIDINFLKDLLCLGLGSRKLEETIWACMGRCTYNGHKITKETFEDVKAREDYLEIMYYIGRENAEPFLKTLMQQFSQLFEAIRKALA